MPGKGFEISLPGGGSKNSKTGRITPPKPSPTPKATGTAAMNGSQYDAYLKKIYSEMQKTKRSK